MGQDPHGDGMRQAHAWVDEAYRAPSNSEQDAAPRFTRFNMVAAYAAGADAARRQASNTYRGWLISFDCPPIPWREFDWSATHPDYDGAHDAHDYRVVRGRTRGDVIAAIDAWYDEQEAF